MSCRFRHDFRECEDSAVRGFKDQKIMFHVTNIESPVRFRAVLAADDPRAKAQASDEKCLCHRLSSLK